jgi:hypothetical protein
VRSWEQAWWEHYADVAVHMRERGGALPAQNDSPEARVLYRWIEAQRRQHDAGTLAQDRIDALDRLGEWIGTRKGDPEELWAQRLEERQFRADVGRFPYYDPDRHPDEKILAVWLGRQRTWWRKGRLRADRQKRLDGVLPGWNASTASRTTGRDISDTGMSDTAAIMGSGSPVLRGDVTARSAPTVPASLNRRRPVHSRMNRGRPWGGCLDGG